MPMRIRALLAGLLPLSLVLGLSLAFPAHAGGANDNTQGSNSQGDNGQGNEPGGKGPAVPEPSSWLVMGAGLLVVGPYLRNRFRRE
jgi:hypothetical protein